MHQAYFFEVGLTHSPTDHETLFIAYRAESMWNFHQL